MLNSLKGLHRVYQYIMQTPNNGHVQEFRSTNPWRAELNVGPDQTDRHCILLPPCYVILELFKGAQDRQQKVLELCQIIPLQIVIFGYYSQCS